MAKKQKKAGMLKRKTQKNIKKTKQRKAYSSRAQSNFNSQKNITQLLVKVPYLIYEPELEDFELDRDKIQQYQAQGMSSPQIILELMDEERQDALFAELEKIQSRYQGNRSKSLMIQGLYHFFGQNIPPFVNPIVVAIYLQTCARMAGESIPSSELTKKISEYEEVNQPIIEQLASEIKANADEATEETLEGEDEEIEDIKPLMVPSEVMQAFHKTTSDEVYDDVEVFTEDYAEKALAEWDLEMVENFQSWFKQNMAPLEEDVANMQASLKQFFFYLNDNQHLSENQKQTILPFFE